MLYFPQMLLSTHQHLSFTRWFCSKKHRGVLTVLYSAFSKFVGRNLAFPEHLSPSPRIPKDFRELQTVTPGAALVGQDKTARLAVHGVQNAGTEKGPQQDLERQHKAIKLHFTAAGTAFPLHFNALFESQAEHFVSAAYLTPGIFSAFIVQAQHTAV